MNSRENNKSEQTQLPLSKSATLALIQLDKLINEINDAFLKALHPDGEEAHDAKCIYINIYDILKIWFKREATADEMSKSIHRDSDHGISINSIRKFFHFTKISLQEGQYDSFENGKKFDNLSPRKKILLMRIIDTYEQLAFFKFLMTNLLAPEFVKAEEEIQEINYENIQYRIKRHTPDTVVHAVVPSLYSIDQLDDASHSDERICGIYASLVQQKLNTNYEILDEYEIFSREIKKTRSGIQQNLDEVDTAIQQHNHVTTLIKNRDEIKSKISKVNTKISDCLKNLTAVVDKDLIRNEAYIDTQLPLCINELKNELSALMKEEETLVIEYNEGMTHLVARRDENVLAATKSKNDLYVLLDALPVLPEVPLPPQFNELLRSRAHKEYDKLNADIKVLQKQKRDLDLEIKAISEAWARVNEIREKCHLMAERVAIFHKMQLDILHEVQRNISVISNDLATLCEEQSTVKQTLSFESGFIPSFVDTQGYKNWKNVAFLASTGLQSIYNISAALSAEFEKLGDGSAKQQEGEAISSFIISKRDEIEVSLRSRLESSKIESKDLELKINENQKQLSIIQSELTAKLQLIYKNGCSQKANIDHTLQLDKARFKRQIDAIEITSANQSEIQSADKDSIISKEHKNALHKIKELEDFLQKKQTQLNKARLAAREAFFAISGSVNAVKRYVALLVQIKSEGFSLENYGLLENEYQALEVEYEEAFKKYNVMCGPIFLSRYQALESRLKDACEEADNARKLHQQKKQKSSHEKPDQVINGVTTAKMYKHLDGNRRGLPPKNNNPDDDSGSENAKNVSDKQKEEPSFWSRHKCKIMLGLTGFVSGAAGGAVAGVFLAPVTWGLSIPVCGVIFGIAGAIGGLISGLFVGSTIDCCLQPDVEDDEPTLNAKPALSVRDDGNQHIETNTVQHMKRSAPRNIHDINSYTRSSSRNASSSGSPKMFAPPAKTENGVDSVSTTERIVVSPGLSQQST